MRYDRGSQNQDLNGRLGTIAAIGGRGTEEISEWLQGGFCIHDLHACMIGFRSDHACMIQNSETDWMRARGQPASALAWPAGGAGSARSPHS